MRLTVCGSSAVGSVCRSGAISSDISGEPIASRFEVMLLYRSIECVKSEAWEWRRMVLNYSVSQLPDEVQVQK